MKAKTQSSKQIILRPGQVVKVYQKVTEGGKERIQVFEGLVIDVHNKTVFNSTFTVRRVIDGIGVEKIFNIHSPFIDKIQIEKQARVRRANLAYMRQRKGKAARMRDEKVMSIIIGGEREEVREENVAIEKEEKNDKKGADGEKTHTDNVEIKEKDTDSVKKK